MAEVPRIGEKYAAVLKKLNIETVEDFLLHFPFRYEDYSTRVNISDLTAGETATVMGEITQSKLIRTWKKKMLITECFITDDTGTVRAVWFNQPYVSDSLTTDKGARLSGKVSEDKKGLYFSNPAWELSSRTPTNTGRLVPIYPETEGLTSKWIRWQMQNLIKFAAELQDPIPPEILKEVDLDERADIYSAGVILYEMLTGSLNGLGSISVIDTVEDVPEWLDDIVIRCLRKVREDRYQSIKDIFTDLKTIKDSRVV